MLSIANPVKFFTDLEKYEGYHKPLGVKTYPAPAGAIYAKPDGSTTANGLTKENAVTIYRALSLVPTGGTIVALKGTYNISSVLNLTKRITIQGELGDELPVFSGAVRPTSFLPHDTVPDVVYFDQPAVFTDMDVNLVPTTSSWLKYPQHVFIDNVPLIQVGTSTGLTPDKFYYNPTTKVINIHASHQSKLVQAIGTETCISITGPVEGCVIRSIAFDKFVLPIHSIRTVTVEDCVFTHSSFCALRLQGFLPWGRIARRNKIFWGGCNGIKSTQCLIEGNEIWMMNTKGYRANYGAAAIKLISNSAVSGFYDPVIAPTILRGNYIHDHFGPGIWIDERIREVLIEKNVVFKGQSSTAVELCIHIEISHGGTVRNNIIQGLIQLTNSRNVQVYNNTCFVPGRNGVVIKSDPRLPPTSPPPTANQIASLNGWSFESYGHRIDNNLLVSETIQGKRLFVQFAPGPVKSLVTPTLVHTFDSMRGNVQARINGSYTSFIGTRVGSTKSTPTDYANAAAFKVKFPTANIDSRTVLGIDTNSFFQADGITPKAILKNPDNSYPGAIQPLSTTGGAILLN